MGIAYLYLIVALLFWPMNMTLAGLPEPPQGTGEHAKQWQPDPMHEYWDPATFNRPQTTLVDGIFTGEACLECHTTITPGIVKEWRASRHALNKSPVLCPACHGTDHQKLFLPTPATCGGCHPERLAQMEAEKKYGFPSHALAMERAVDSKHFADKPKAEVVACLQCHSVGSKCDSCHTRHLFDPAEARRPEACQTCHNGPPHPDDESYLASPHGQRYQKEGDSWDWRQPLTKENYKIPTCAYCHMRHGNHQVADKAVWKFGTMEINPQTAANQIKRKRWLATCGDCHPLKTAQTFFDQLDNERKSAWNILYAIEKQLKKLRSDGLIRPTARERPPYPFDFLARLFPFERIGHFEGQSLAFYNVSAIERDYFEMWYFTNLAAYKGMAHGATEHAKKLHRQLKSQAHAITKQVEEIRHTNNHNKKIDLTPLWMEGEYTQFNQDHN